MSISSKHLKLSAVVFISISIVNASCDEVSKGDDIKINELKPLCENGEDIMQPAPDGGPDISVGIEACDDESWHRYAAVVCTDTLWDDGCGGLGELGCPANQVGCKNGSDELECVTPCQSDADCEPNEVCLCEQAQNWVTRCVPAGCRTDADCAPFECGLSMDYSPDGSNFACRTGSDVCHGVDDCEAGFLCGFEEGEWQCIEGFNV